MFQTSNVPCTLEGLRHKKIKVGSDEYKGSELTLRIDPFTPALASELAETKSVIYRRNDTEANPHIDAVAFNYVPRPQRIEIRPDPELKPSVTILEAKVGKFRVRKPKDGTQWVLMFKATLIEVDAKELLYLKEALFEQRFFTFSPAAPGLFDEAEAEARKDSPDAKPVRRSAGGGTATAH